MPFAKQISDKSVLYLNILSHRARVFFHGRRFHGYCVGTAKSGTHSIASMFQTHYLSTHEPLARQNIRRINDLLSKRISESEFEKWLLFEDKLLGLEMNSSQLNYWFLDTLVRKYRDAKFILTIRDCYSWLDSLINHSLRETEQMNRSELDSDFRKMWLRIRNIRFDKGLKHAPGEKALYDKGLYTLDEYFSYWAEHNNRVIKTVPPDRLLIVRTDKIDADIARIADFFSIDPKTLEKSRSHTFKGPKKFNMLSSIDPAYLKDRVDFHCKALMDKFFPDMQNHH